MKELFSKRLKALREEKKCSQDDIAKELNISRNSIYFYENDKRVPDANTIIALAEFFGVTTDYLLGVSNFTSDEDKSTSVNLLEELSQKINCIKQDEKYQLLKNLTDILDTNNNDIILFAFLEIVRGVSLIKGAYSVASEAYNLNHIMDELNKIANKGKTSLTVGNVRLEDYLQKISPLVQTIPDFTMMSAKYVYHIQKTVSDLISALQSNLEDNPKLKKTDKTPLISNVEILKNNMISVTFNNNTKKVYDVTECLRDKKYRSEGAENLTDEEVMKTIKIANDGYFLHWLDDIGFRSTLELWTEGQPFRDNSFEVKDGESHGNNP